MQRLDRTLPEGYRRILLADTQRALQWIAGLKGQGIAAQRLEAVGEDSEKASWMIVVPRADELAAKAYVSAVLNEQERLPYASTFPAWGVKALLGIGLLVFAVLLLTWLGQ